jgi:hypothetical protein
LESDDEKPHGTKAPKKKTKKVSSAAKTVNLRWALIMPDGTCLIFQDAVVSCFKGAGTDRYILAFLLLGAFILLGVHFDIIGISVAFRFGKAVSFHGVAKGGRRVRGACPGEKC